MTFRYEKQTTNKKGAIMPASEEEEVLHRCYNCDEEYEIDDLYANDWDINLRCCGCNEDYVCEMEEQQNEEEESNSPINCYSYKPSAIFLNEDGHKSYYATQPYSDNPNRTKLYMGFELELETGRFPRNDCAQFVLDTINTQSNDIVYIKEDGSLENGFEIVSHPMTLGFAMEHFSWDGISGLIKRGCKSWDAGTCGLHVHLSRSAFRDEKHLFKFFKLLLDNAPDVKRFAGRDSERWANFDKNYFLNAWNDYDVDGNWVTRTNDSLMKHAKNESRNDNRYCAVNLQNRHTVELRFFKPSLNPKTVQSALQFCDAVFNYTETECDTKKVMSGNALAFRSFRSWVATQERYALLSARIAERCDN
jgi:hypothetical protein